MHYCNVRHRLKIHLSTIAEPYILCVKAIRPCAERVAATDYVQQFAYTGFPRVLVRHKIKWSFNMRLQIFYFRKFEVLLFPVFAPS